MGVVAFLLGVLVVLGRPASCAGSCRGDCSDRLRVEG
jgi:hypothetical protein